MPIFTFNQTFDNISYQAVYMPVIVPIIGAGYPTGEVELREQQGKGTTGYAVRSPHNTDPDVEYLPGEKCIIPNVDGYFYGSPGLPIAYIKLLDVASASFSLLVRL